jgi:hypothetical protein
MRKRCELRLTDKRFGCCRIITLCFDEIDLRPWWVIFALENKLTTTIQLHSRKIICGRSSSRDIFPDPLDDDPRKQN